MTQRPEDEEDEDTLSDLELSEEEEEELLSEELFAEEDIPEEWEEEKEIPPSIQREPVEQGSKSPPPPSEKEQKQAIAPAAPLSSPREPMPLHEIPLTLAVEIGKIRLPLEKLLKLEVGNLLDVEGQGNVFLTLQGKVVARGELVRMGDVIGIRVLELG